MVKPHLFPSYQPLTLHLAYLSVTYLLLYPSSSHCNSRSTHGVKLKLTPTLALDKRSQLMTPSTFSRDLCKFDRLECNFANVNKI